MKRFALARGTVSGALRTALGMPSRSQHRRGRSDDLAAIQAVFEHSPDGTVIADAGTLAIIATNVAVQKTLGFAPDELRGLTLLDLLVAVKEGDQEALGRQLRDPQPRFPMRLGQRRKDGSLLDIEAFGYRVELERGAVLAYSLHDVTVRAKAEARLLEKQQHLDHLAHHDQLTGLPNRHFLAAYLPMAIEKAKAKGAAFAVLFLDLDRFKDINDSRGHEIGDKLLQAVAERLQQAVRAEDLVVRMGGDEFIVVLKDVHEPREVDQAATRIAQALAVPVLIDKRPLMATASIGASIYPRDGGDMGELLRRSDTAMYQAKEAGRNNFKSFSPSMDREIKERVLIEAGLRAALARGHLEVHYQPIVEIASQRVVALEALLRLRHSSGGLIGPERFIGTAEETGLIVPVGEFVLDRVMHDARTWGDGGLALVPIAVNISAEQLKRSDLVATVEKLSRAHGFDPKLLQLEFTESAVFERRRGMSGQSNEDAVQRLRDLGVLTAIDDFGTGYSSLSYLKRWKFDCLKIDRSFIRDVVRDPSDFAIVSAIIAMAGHLHIPVVAEGVDAWQQLETLRELGCARAQGYLFARPTTAERCRRYLSGVPLDLTHSDTRAHPSLEPTIANPHVASI